MPDVSTSFKKAAEPQVAVKRFLADMAKAAKRTFPAWHGTLTAGIEECPLNYDQRRALLDIHPLDDYYFAGVVALEASKIRELFAPDEAAELLSVIGEQVDAAAGRTDRVVSDLVFAIISRVELSHGADQKNLPYDQVVKAILQRLGIDKVEATQHLMSEALYRHTLGEPLALGVPEWWRMFKTKYRLPEQYEKSPPTIVVPRETLVVKTVPAKPSKAPRRAVLLH